MKRAVLWVWVLGITSCGRLHAGQESVRYWYDAAGRLRTAGYAVSVTNTAAIQYGYDADGNRTNRLVLGVGDTTNADGDDLRDVDELAFFGDLSQDGGGDADGDGLDTDDELAQGSDPTRRDTDGDDADDRHEWVADTCPNDANSFFHVTSVTNRPPVEVRFRSSSRRDYTLVVSTGLCGSAWADVPGQGPRPGVDGEDMMSDTNAPAGARFYGVRVEVP